ncbi:MAG: addiction module toxin RelE [Acidobacteria bacterium]|nr:addiction module toxin RelE [Acidobacteriota bacterium]
MASYRIVIKRSAAKELESISGKRDRERMVRRIQSLADEPRPMGAEKLAGRGDKYRILQGDYRILYEIEDDVLIVTVVKIGDRKDVYRR